MGTLWNTYAFFVLYANIDQFDATKYQLDYEKLSLMDRWLLSKLNSVVASVDENLDQYRIPEAARALQDFVDEMSNWYVRRSRDRFWGPDMTQDKINAYMTLYTALVTIAKASAPMIPFMAEDIYRNLVCSIDPNAPESVHLCDFPVPVKEYIDPALEESMEEVLQIVVLGRAARNAANRKNRQPLSRMFVAGKTLDPTFCQIIADELNVKEVSFTDDVSGYVDYLFKPQLKTLGPKFGKKLGEVRQALSQLDGKAAKKELDASGSVTLQLSDGPVSLGAEDLLIETVQSQDFVTMEEGGTAVALDITLTPQLLEEGFVREVISKVQTMRKEADFNVTDHITLYVKGKPKACDLIRSNQKAICQDVLAEEIVFDSLDGYQKEWDINGETVMLGVKQR